MKSKYNIELASKKNIEDTDAWEVRALRRWINAGRLNKYGYLGLKNDATA
jgi:hypothetical protein